MVGQTNPPKRRRAAMGGKAQKVAEKVGKESQISVLCQSHGLDPKIASILQERVSAASAKFMKENPNELPKDHNFPMDNLAKRYAKNYEKIQDYEKRVESAPEKKVDALKVELNSLYEEAGSIVKYMVVKDILESAPESLHKQQQQDANRRRAEGEKRITSQADNLRKSEMVARGIDTRTHSMKIADNMRNKMDGGVSASTYKMQDNPARQAARAARAAKTNGPRGNPSPTSRVRW